MATYPQITKWVAANYGYKPKSCWIAHVKFECGLPVRQAPNRHDASRREVECPEAKKPNIKAALRHFKMI